MNLVLDAFWRALAYCLHPRVIVLSFLPLVVMVAASFALGYWFWEGAVAAVAAWFEVNEVLTLFLNWLDSMGAGAMRAVFAPLVVLFLATPVIVVASLLLVGFLMTPAMVTLVAERRFGALERKQGGTWWGSLLWSLGSSTMALLALMASLPLWLIPPLIMVLPPLIWGWLTYRVFAYDALALHASPQERRQVFTKHRYALLLIGVLSGYLATLPSLLWASGAMFVAMAPILVPLAIWIYALIFAFSALWFTHYSLAALVRLRQAPLDVAVAEVSDELLPGLTPVLPSGDAPSRTADPTL